LPSHFIQHKGDKMLHMKDVKIKLHIQLIFTSSFTIGENKSILPSHTN